MRNQLVISLGLLAICGLVQAENVPPHEITVYRSPSCGCCGKWLEHLRTNHFNVIDKMLEDVQSIKKQVGVSPELASCHTAIISGKVVEGHVPANDIVKLLTLKSDIVGITVPGMPIGTPGMEMGPRKEAYQVLSFDNNKHTQVFSEYGAAP